MTFDDSRPDDDKLERLWDPELSDAIRDAQADLDRLDQWSGRVLAGVVVIVVLLLTLALVITLKGGA
jgi:hypothetical protein